MRIWSSDSRPLILGRAERASRRMKATLVASPLALSFRGASETRPRNDGSLGRPQLLQRLARGRQVGPQLQRLAEVGDGARLVAEPHPGLTAIVPREDVGGIVLQRLVVVGDAALVIALVEFDHATVAPAARIGRRHPDDLAIV